MPRRKPTLTKYQQRLVNLIMGLKEKEIREMLIEILAIEGKYRSAKRFPLTEVRDVIDSFAVIFEREHSEEEKV